jgi:predicted lipoprotein
MPATTLLERLALVVVLLLLAGPGEAAAQPEFDHAGLARQALERHIRPGYQRLAAATAELDGAMPSYCEHPAPASRKAVETAFDAVVTAWGRIEHIAFGPVTTGERLERIMFWPDRRGIGARQVANALSTRDPAVVDAARLAEKSAAMQGLPALDTLLFAASPEAGEQHEATRHRCAFAAAVAINLARIAKTILAEWTDAGGFSQSWLSPGAGNAHYLKPGETTLALAKAFDQGLERVRDQRLGGPLGLNAQRRKLPAVLAKSGRTMRLIGANIEGLLELYVEGGIERAITATAASDAASSTPSLAHLVQAELQTAHAGVAALVGVASPFEAPENVQRVIALGFPLKNARVTAATLLSTSANLPLGFNASDGD